MSAFDASATGVLSVVGAGEDGDDDSVATAAVTGTASCVVAWPFDSLILLTTAWAFCRSSSNRPFQNS